MNRLENIEVVVSIPARLGIAQRALSEATDDWQRSEIRDYVKAMPAQRF